MRHSIRRLLCIGTVVILSLFPGFCLAEDPWEYEKTWFYQFYVVYPKQLYNAKKTDYKGQIVWTIMHDERDGQELHLLKSISLESGKVREWTINNEYIIQKDPEEYDGILYAATDDEQVRIWLINPDGRREQLAEYTITCPYWYRGDQTVRAYMHGTLYYIKSLEKSEPKEAGRSAVLCSIDAEGNEYVYQLNNDAKPVRAVFHYFAISPHGKVAWVTAKDAAGYRINGESILVETPGEGVRSVLPEGIEEKMGWGTVNGSLLGGIYGQCLCWIDEEHLLFGSRGAPGSNRKYLYILQTDLGEVKPLLNADGDPIKMYHSVQGASCVCYIRDENLIAYLGSPNRLLDWDIDADEAAVPHIIDLSTGRNYVLYQVKAKEAYVGEFRNQTGQLSWMKTKK